MLLAVQNYARDGAVLDPQHVVPAVLLSNIHGETVNASPSGTCVNGVEGISGNYVPCGLLCN